MNYARVRPVGYDYKQAIKDKLNHKEKIKNPDAQLYLALKRKGMLKKVLHLFKLKDETYKEWIERNETKTI